MSINVSTDLRARRTRKWLQEAFVELMKEKPFKRIQITEIADRAEVSRPAFYLHFHSKEELLISHIDVVFDEFYEEAKREMEAGNMMDRKQISIMLFQHWKKHANTLQMVVDAGAQGILLERLRLHANTVISEIRSRKKKNAIPSASLHEYVVDFFAGGAYMLLSKWLANNMSHSAEQMGELFYDLTLICESLGQS
jgi:AcrR family transcriptional regulator